MSGDGVEGVSYKLGELQAAAEQGRRERRDMWQLMEQIRQELGAQSKLLLALNARLEDVVGADGRLAKVEQGVADYRKTKQRALGLVGGISLAGGGLGTFLSNFFHWKA